MIPTTASEWSPLRIPAALMTPDSSAPVPTPENTPVEFAVTFARMLQDMEIVDEALGICLATGPVLLYGAKEFIASANRLTVAGDPTSMREEIQRLLGCVQTLASERSRAFVVQQVGGTLRRLVAAPAERSVKSETLARFRSPRGYEAVFDQAFRTTGVLAHLDAQSYGQLAIRLDEFYDDSCLQLRRLGELTSLDFATARSHFADFFQGLYDDYALASFGDHLFAEDSDTGLVKLLPELERAVHGI